MKQPKLKYVALAFSAVLICMDQFFKFLAKEFLSHLPALTFPVIQDVFHLTYLENRGAAFGIFSGKALFLIGLTGIIILVLILSILLNKIEKPFILWSMSLIIGGGIGNLIDRVFRHYVIDYLDFRIIEFAVFNFADCCVVVGTILIMIYLLFFEWRTKPNQEDNQAAGEGKGDA